MRKVRFRTLGCYPLTGAVESDADTLPEIIREMLPRRVSERQGRVIDHDATARWRRRSRRGTSERAARLARPMADRRHGRLPARRAQEPASLHHLRQRRRRQEHADRPPALRVEACCSTTSSRRSKPTRSGSARRAASSTSRFCSTASRPSASRASRSTSPTATSRPSDAQLHRRRHARPRAVHAQHGHGRLDRRTCAVDPRRRAQGRARRRRGATATSCRCSASATPRLAVNKMDLVDYDEATFREIESRVPRLRRASSASTT